MAGSPIPKSCSGSYKSLNPINPLQQNKMLLKYSQAWAPREHLIPPAVRQLEEVAKADSEAVIEAAPKGPWRHAPHSAWILALRNSQAWEEVNRAPHWAVRAPLSQKRERRKWIKFRSWLIRSKCISRREKLILIMTHTKRMEGPYKKPILEYLSANLIEGWQMCWVIKLKLMKSCKFREVRPLTFKRRTQLQKMKYQKLHLDQILFLLINLQRSISHSSWTK